MIFISFIIICDYVKHLIIDLHIYSALETMNYCKISKYKYKAQRVNKECLIFQNLQLIHGNKAFKLHFLIFIFLFLNLDIKYYFVSMD